MKEEVCVCVSVCVWLSHLVGVEQVADVLDEALLLDLGVGKEEDDRLVGLARNLQHLQGAGKGGGGAGEGEGGVGSHPHLRLYVMPSRASAEHTPPTAADVAPLGAQAQIWWPTLPPTLLEAAPPEVLRSSCHLTPPPDSLWQEPTPKPPKPLPRPCPHTFLRSSCHSDLE